MIAPDALRRKSPFKALWQRRAGTWRRCRVRTPRSETCRHEIVSRNHNAAQFPPSGRRAGLRKTITALARSFRLRIPQPPAPRGHQDRACSQRT